MIRLGGFCFIRTRKLNRSSVRLTNDFQPKPSINLWRETKSLPEMNLSHSFMLDFHCVLLHTAAIFDSSSSVGSSEGEAAVYEPQELELPIFSASSASKETFDEDSQSSDIEIEADDFFVSEAGLEALAEAEGILKEGYAEEEDAESSESLPDFDDTSDLTSLLQDDEASEFSEAGRLHLLYVIRC